MERVQAKLQVQKQKAEHMTAEDDKSKDCLKSPLKENKKLTKAQLKQLHTQQRAAKRAAFNDNVSTKIFIDQLRKKVEERVQRIMKEEEIRSIRKDMVPKAQLMPYFDKPFSPQRSDRPLTIPKEPKMRFVNGKSFQTLNQINS